MIQIVLQALRVAGTDDRPALRDALEKVRFSGFYGDFKYSATDHQGNSGEAFVPVITKQGKYRPYKK